ncbi:hypothetical protein KJ365_15100 [Glaciecola sp. XM2]|uniref:hypothetical protein n=1 Tax=Glaciecola sp. XM2 TaxID=1914931 RepID=UPI001BDE090E|nr:hypothetical protein [Glaciecola sp. XM2]MBT1452213.1 hypothetical protein [Glaciecola sp. XM2]
MKSQYMKALFYSAVMFASAAQHVNAQTVADAIGNCSKEENALKRLVCFDEIAKSINRLDGANQTISELAGQTQNIQNQTSTAPSAPVAPPVTVASNDAEQEQVDSFGLDEPTEDKTFLVDGELNSTIKEIEERTARRTRFILENGQIWELAESTSVGLPRVGDKIVIRERALGSYFLRKASVNRSFRVKRVEN